MSWLDTMATNAGINKDYTSVGTSGEDVQPKQGNNNQVVDNSPSLMSVFKNMMQGAGGTFLPFREGSRDMAQSALDSAANVYGNIAYFAGNPYGIGDTLRNYAQENEQAMGPNPEPSFSWDYIMNGGLGRDFGALVGSVGALAPAIALGAVGASAAGASAPVIGAAGGIAAALGESAAEGGGTLADSLAQGLDLDEAESRAREVAGKNALFLGATNAASGGLMGKFLKGIAQNIAGKGANKLVDGITNQAGSGFISQGTKETLKGAGTLGFSALNEGFQEAEQDAISASVDPTKYASYNPMYWSDEQWEDFKRTIGPTAIMGALGGIGGNVSYNAGLDNATQEEPTSNVQQATMSIPSQANYTIADEVSDANLSQGTES